MSSRIHELARLSFTDLVALWHLRAGDVQSRVFASRDEVITAIRDQEDPHRLAMPFPVRELAEV